MKEAFKIGGYAWHAHKRFEEIKDGWDFLKTVEWLKTIGIRFSNDSLRRFVNVYATYQSAQVAKGSLTDSYVVVNQQAENLSQLPERKIEVLGNLFRALPSDDTTNPKELIRELIRAGKVFAVTERTIQRWKPEAMKQKRLSQEEVQKIYELRDQGKTQREIAEEIGVSQSAVNQNIRNDKCQNLSDPSPEPSNVIPSPVQFQKQESINDYDDEGVGGSNLLSVPCKAFGSIFSSYSTLPGEVSLLHLLELLTFVCKPCNTCNTCNNHIVVFYHRPTIRVITNYKYYSVLVIACNNL